MIMTLKKLPPLVCAALAVSPFALAQDSVGLGGPLPGDGVSPYSTTEQGNRYTVDLQVLTTGWGNDFVIGPTPKSSQTSDLFTSSLLGASGISRLTIKDSSLAGAWSEITVPTQGVNDDPSKNLAAPSIAAPVATGVQLASTFSEFSTTDGGAGYDGVISNIIKYDPANPTRLYVERINAATNGCVNTDELTTAFAGGVGADGGVFIRADDFGVSGVGCGGGVTGNNIFYVNTPVRDQSIVNALSNDLLTSGDFIATTETVKNAGTTFNVPSLIEVGGVPFLAGGNFATEFVSNFGEGMGFGQRIFLIYDGIHYDPLYREKSSAKEKQTLFDVGDDSALEEAKALVAVARNARQFTDVNKFELRCLACQTPLKGQEDARSHAAKTGHTNFGEV